MNAFNDYKITHSKSLEFVWAEIIEVTCEKINPFFEEPQIQIRQIRARTTRASSETEAPKQRYVFKTEEEAE